jgi:flagellar protein FlaF
MGFSVSGAAAIIFASMFIAFGMWYTAADNSFSRVTDAQDAQSESSLETSNTAIEIISASYSSGTLTVEINNTGTTQLSLNQTDLLIDGQYETDWQAANATVAGDGSTDLWLPGEQLTITLDRASQPDRLKLVTESGVGASAEVT